MTQAVHRGPSVFLVSFSGIDGAGKSTQISALRARLVTAGVSVTCRMFWEDVAMLRQLRTLTSHKVFKGDQGIGSPDRAIQRRDKNVRGWHLTLIRLLLYLLDAIHLKFTIAALRSTNTEVIIVDRYIFDELVNLPLRSRFIRAYIRVLLKWVPRPDIAYLLDADPSLACQRKPEYPPDFLEKHRQDYLELRELIPEMRAIAGSTVSDVQRQIVHELVAQWPSRKGKRLSRVEAFAESQAG